jgi:Tol biopolymer transport system component
MRTKAGEHPNPRRQLHLSPRAALATALTLALAFVAVTAGSVDDANATDSRSADRPAIASGEHAPENGRIVFSRLDPETQRVRLHTVRPDGSGLRILTSSPEADDAKAAWSPDGGRIAFMRAFGPLSDKGLPATVGIFVMDADGSNVGRRIAFLRWNGTVEPPNASAIYSVAADGGPVRLLRRIPPRFPGGGTSDWSPDGRRIPFTTYCFYGGCGGPATGAQLFTMNPDSRQLRQVTHVAGNAYQPGWSPDGTKIVFTRNRVTDGPSDVFTINADGSGLRHVTRAATPDLFADYPDWWPRPTRRMANLTRVAVKLPAMPVIPSASME